MKIDNFRGELTDISARTEALEDARVRVARFASVHSCLETRIVTGVQPHESATSSCAPQAASFSRISMWPSSAATCTACLPSRTVLRLVPAETTGSHKPHSPVLTAYRMQWFFSSRNIVYVTPRIIWFHYLQKKILDASIQRTFNLILKTAALVIWLAEVVQFSHHSGMSAPVVLFQSIYRVSHPEYYLFVL